jgi:hypothetical protein
MRLLFRVARFLARSVVLSVLLSIGATIVVRRLGLAPAAAGVVL